MPSTRIELALLIPGTLHRILNQYCESPKVIGPNSLSIASKVIASTRKVVSSGTQPMKTTESTSMRWTIAKSRNHNIYTICQKQYGRAEKMKKTQMIQWRLKLRSNPGEISKWTTYNHCLQFVDPIKGTTMANRDSQEMGHWWISKQIRKWWNLSVTLEICSKSTQEALFGGSMCIGMTNLIPPSMIKRVRPAKWKSRSSRVQIIALRRYQRGWYRMSMEFQGNRWNNVRFWVIKTHFFNIWLWTPRCKVRPLGIKAIT